MRDIDESRHDCVLLYGIMPIMTSVILLHSSIFRELRVEEIHTERSVPSRRGENSIYPCRLQYCGYNLRQSPDLLLFVFPCQNLYTNRGSIINIRIIHVLYTIIYEGVIKV